MQFFWNKKKDNTLVITNEMQQADSYLGTILNTVKNLSRRLSSGGGMFGVSPNGKRNYNELFGYGNFLVYEDFYGMYKRGGIAAVVVGKVAKSCWRDMPEIKVNDEPILEEQLLKLKNKKFFKALERADILNRIGNFSIMLLGLPDGEKLDLPVGSAKKDSFDSMYFNVYGYNGIEIVKSDTDPASPRFGLPVIYQLQVINIDNAQRKESMITTLLVHYSRVVHMAEGALDSSIEGMSSLEQPWNALTDKEKTRGSSAEAYYRNSRQKLALETNEGSKVSSDPEVKKALKENVEQFQNGFEDTLRLNNMKANMLQPAMASPRDPFDICVEEISGTSGIPIRILTGKGGGNLVGSEDKATWNALVKDRQDQECTVYLLDALAVMAEAGIIDLPEGAEVVWPVQSSLSEKEASESSKNKGEAFKAVADGLSTIGGDDVVAKSVFKSVGLEDIDIDEINLTDDVKLNKDIKE